MKKKKVISAVMACVLVCGIAFGVHAIGNENSSQEAASVFYDSSELAEFAEQVAVLVNKERTANGLQPVKVSPKLSNAANVRARELKENFSHTRPDGTSCFTAMDEEGIKYSSAAENIAYGQKSPESVMNAWMNSSGHRANILNKNMQYIGVGVFYQNGIYYWAQFFAVSDSLTDGAYLPNEDTVTTPVTTTKPITTQATTAKPATTTQTTTTKPVTTTKTTTKPVTTQTTINSTTTQKTTAIHTTTSASTTESNTDKPQTTKQTTTSQQTTAGQTTTTSKMPITTDCNVVVVTKPIISQPSSGVCSSIGSGAVIVVYPK